jgi:hypothetical protein
MPSSIWVGHVGLVGGASPAWRHRGPVRAAVGCSGLGVDGYRPLDRFRAAVIESGIVIRRGTMWIVDPESNGPSCVPVGCVDGSNRYPSVLIGWPWDHGTLSSWHNSIRAPHKLANQPTVPAHCSLSLGNLALWPLSFFLFGVQSRQIINQEIYLRNEFLSLKIILELVKSI